MTDWTLPTLREGLNSFRFENDFKVMTNRARSSVPRDIIPPEKALDFLIQLIQLRIENRFDAVVCITGDEGDGKSTLALRLAQRLNPVFESSELAYDAKQILHSYRVTEPGKPIIYDESVRGLLATDTFSKPQKALIQTLSLVREKRCVLILCAPSIWLVAKQIRGRRVTFWIHIFDRGKARVHERDKKLNYTPTDTLGLAISLRIPKLTWDDYPLNDSFKKSYDKVKDKNLSEFLLETEALVSARPRRSNKEGQSDR